MSTDAELVEMLMERNVDGKYDDLIFAAEDGAFHDFRSEHAFPKIELVQRLSAFPELADIAQMVKNGDFDE
jgi:hypothetical protein